MTEQQIIDRQRKLIGEAKDACDLVIHYDDMKEAGTLPPGVHIPEGYQLPFIKRMWKQLEDDAK